MGMEHDTPNQFKSQLQMFNVEHEPWPEQVDAALHNELVQLSPLQPELQLQLFGEEQLPRPEHTITFVSFKPKQVTKSQLKPVYPVEQLQVLNSLHEPWELQALEEFDWIELQYVTEQVSPIQPFAHLHVFAAVQFPLPLHTRAVSVANTPLQVGTEQSLVPLYPRVQLHVL